MIQSAQMWLLLLLSLVAVAVSFSALIHGALMHAASFTAAEKKTKTFWLVILGLAAVLAFLGIPRPLGVGGNLLFSLGALIAGGIYLADVRPAVRNAGGRKGPRRRGGGFGSGPPSWRSW